MKYDGNGVKKSGNDEAEGGAIPQLSRNCDGNESLFCHCPVYRDGKAGE